MEVTRQPCADAPAGCRLHPELLRLVCSFAQASCTANVPACSPGPPPPPVEEYAEGLAFKVYLNEGRLITQAEVELAEVEECEWGSGLGAPVGRWLVCQLRRLHGPAGTKVQPLLCTHCSWHPVPWLELPALPCTQTWAVCWTSPASWGGWPSRR